MQLAVFKIPEELWQRFHKKYGRQKATKLRQFILEDLEKGEN